MEGGNGGSKFHKLLGRGLTDYDFREALMDKERQADALRSMDIEPTQEVLDELNRSIDSLNNLAKSETLGGNSVAVG